MIASDLEALLERLVKDPALVAADGKTFCNIASRRVAQAFGCHEFDSEAVLADGMVAIMAQNWSTRWALSNGKDAADHAMAGGLAFAAMTSGRLGEAHGHIAALVPQPQQMSGSLGRYVPMIANVGKTNGIMRTSGAFPVAAGMPDFYTWTPLAA